MEYWKYFVLYEIDYLKYTSFWSSLIEKIAFIEMGLVQIFH